MKINHLVACIINAINITFRNVTVRPFTTNSRSEILVTTKSGVRYMILIKPDTDDEE
jgi:hypothetical protein